MKLLRLKLDNFRQHRSSDIHFTGGMTAIVGANGTGKTTILEAITFALYGVQRKNKETIKFYWSEPRTKPQVLLEFEFEGRTYRLSRSSTDAALIDATSETEVVKATGLKEVKAACERLLRLTYEQFKNSFCAEQKSLTFLQFSTDTRRQEQVAKMLGFDRLKGAAELARERGRDFRVKSEALTATMGNVDQLRSDLVHATSQLKEAKALLELANRSKAALDKQLPRATEQKVLADRFFALTQDSNVFGAQAEVLKTAKKRAEETHTQAQVDAARRKVLLPMLDEHDRIAKDLIELHSLRELGIEREKLCAEQARIETEIADFTVKLTAVGVVDVEGARKRSQAAGAQYTDAVNALRKTEANWSKLKQAAQGEFSARQTELRQATASLERARILAEKGICPECGQPTTATFELRLKDLAAELEVAGKAHADAAKALTSLEAKTKDVLAAEDAVEAAAKEQDQAQKALTESEKSAVVLQGLSADLAARRERQTALRLELQKSIPLFDQKKHAELSGRLAQLVGPREECLKLAGADEALASALKSLDRANLEYESAKSGYRTLIEERHKLGFANPAAADTAVRVFEETRARASEAEIEVGRAETAVKLAQSAATRAEDCIANYQKSEALLKESRSAALHYESTEREMKLLREELNSVIRPDLEIRAGDNLSILTNGRYPVLELDEEFNATVVEDGVSKHVISGGEEDIVALALRMALSELIQERQGRPMSLLILDEVFGGLDADRRQAVLERLQAIKGRFAQILVISHIEEINQVADQCIYLTRDERTRATIVGDPPLDTTAFALTP